MRKKRLIGAISALFLFSMLAGQSLSASALSLESAVTPGTVVEQSVVEHNVTYDEGSEVHEYTWQDVDPSSSGTMSAIDNATWVTSYLKDGRKVQHKSAKEYTTLSNGNYRWRARAQTNIPNFYHYSRARIVNLLGGVLYDSDRKWKTGLSDAYTSYSGDNNGMYLRSYYGTP